MAEDHYYTFSRCTENLEIVGPVVRGRANSQRDEIGTVVTRQPLQPQKSFEFEIKVNPSGCTGTFEIGLTNDEQLPYFESTSKSETRRSGHIHVMTCGRSISVFRNGGAIKDANIILGRNTDDRSVIEYQIGFTLGISIRSNNVLVCHVNGKDYEVNLDEKEKIIPELSTLLSGSCKLYGVIRMSCETSQVSLTARHSQNVELPYREQVRPPGKTGVDAVLYNMRAVVRFLQSVPDIDKKQYSSLISTYMLEPYEKHTDERVRQKLGDHLAELGAETVLKSFDHDLRLGYDSHEGGTKNPYFEPLRTVRKVCWHYAEASLKLGRAFGKSEYLVDMLNELKRFGINCDCDKDKQFLQYSAFAILYNSANAVENKSIYKKHNVQATLSEFLHSENQEMVTGSFMGMVHMLGVVDEIESVYLDHPLSMLEEAIDDPYLRRHSDEYGQYSAKELVIGLGKIAAANDHNKDIIIKTTALRSFSTLLSLDKSPLEQEVTANALMELSKLHTCRVIIASNETIMRELRRLQAEANDPAVRKAADRSVTAIQNGNGHKGGGSRPDKKKCAYAKLCRRYRDKQLRLAGALFEEKNFKCYCNVCHTERGDTLYYSHGEPCKEYGRPIGWYRFALKVPPRAEVFNAYKSWHIAFHGTNQEALTPILECGNLLMPGDKTLKGRVLGQNKGRPTDDNRDPAKKNHIFLSPSIRYAGHDQYALPSDYLDEETNKMYKAKTVFRVLIHPETYEVGPASFKGGEDPNFSPQELEWSTDRRGNIVMYAVLVNLEEH